MVSFSSALNFIPYDEFNNNFILEKKENKTKQKASEIPPNNYSTQESQMQNSKCDIYSQKVFGHHRNLSSEHRMLFNNIINAYQLGENYVNGLSINNCISTVSLVQYLNEQNTMHESLIYFYKSIPEFKQLRVDDQMVLIKCNLIKIIHLHYILIEKFQENPSIGLYMSKWISEDFHYGFSRARRYFDYFKEHSLI
ncbi:unnamed protein product [Rotaria socialis]|uniref:Uncharacterized protein n=1 Tax=Rotaria socialis TaxID=392032 RepID=A0A821PS02_9BILA|nr:unnamed protein product [Rotaria socialis]